MHPLFQQILQTHLQQPQSKYEPQDMGFHKNHLLTLQHECAPENNFAQDAIEHALNIRLIRLTYNLREDTIEIMSRYDEIVETYQNFLRAELDAELAELQRLDTAA